MKTRQNASVATGWATIRSLACVLLYCIGFGLTSFVIGRNLPFPEVPTVRPKLDWLAKHGDEFDVLFVGSSRVEQQIIPAVFDRTAAELGHTVRSFNAGVSAMTPPEDAYLIEQILQRPHARLRWVFIELMPIDGQFDPFIAGTGRMDYWHDAPRMWLMTRRAVADCARVWQERGTHAQHWTAQCSHCFEVWGKHVHSFAMRASNCGRGAELVAARYRRAKKHPGRDGGGPAGDGWTVPEGIQPMRDNVLAEYERTFAELREASRKHAEDAPSEASLRGVIALLHRHGCETILFFPPTVAPSQFFPQRVMATVPLIDLSDPAEHPELYVPDNRRDGMHLNLAGAGLFSQELAARFVQSMKDPSRFSR